MSKKYKRKGQKKFVLVWAATMKTAAWADLTPADISVYLQVKYRYNGTNNGSIGCGCRELAAACNISKDTANRSLIRLQERGFIKAVKQGYFRPGSSEDGSLKNRATEWRLTEYPCDVTGELPTKDYHRWEPKTISVAPRGQRVSSQGPSPLKLVAANG
jgi:hypothetical protein